MPSRIQPHERRPAGCIWWMPAAMSAALRVRPDGSAVDTVLATAAPASRGIVLDAANRTLIWASRDSDRIQRARLEGRMGLRSIAETTSST